eukprot:634875-Prorocentrum_minimum.AAC.1
MASVSPQPRAYDRADTSESQPRETYAGGVRTMVVRASLSMRCARNPTRQNNQRSPAETAIPAIAHSLEVTDIPVQYSHP